LALPFILGGLIGALILRRAVKLEEAEAARVAARKSS
jgi:hypothetical protein